MVIYFNNRRIDFLFSSILKYIDTGADLGEGPWGPDPRLQKPLKKIKICYPNKKDQDHSMVHLRDHSMLWRRL